MARYVSPGVWQCDFCLRVLPEGDFAVDRWRQRMKKGPGRCNDSEREYARAKSAFSPSSRYSDADHHSAYHAAKDTCRQHAWGSGYYSLSDKAHYREVVAVKSTGVGQGKDEIRTSVQRHADEAALHERAERNRAERERDLELAAQTRAKQVRQEEIAVVDDPEKAARKAAIRARRARR